VCYSGPFVSQYASGYFAEEIHTHTHMDTKRDEEEAPPTATPHMYSSEELWWAAYNYYAGNSQCASRLRYEAAKAAHMEAKRARHDALFIKYELKLATMTAAAMAEPWKEIRFLFNKRAEFVDAWPVLHALAIKHDFFAVHRSHATSTWETHYSESIEFMPGGGCVWAIDRLFRSKHAPYDPEDWRPDAPE
jgi:hypothetical protein